MLLPNHLPFIVNGWATPTIWSNETQDLRSRLKKEAEHQTTDRHSGGRGWEEQGSATWGATVEVAMEVSGLQRRAPSVGGRGRGRGALTCGAPISGGPRVGYRAVVLWCVVEGSVYCCVNSWLVNPCKHLTLWQTLALFPVQPTNQWVSTHFSASVSLVCAI